MVSSFCRLILCGLLGATLAGCSSPDYVYCHDVSYTTSMFLYLKNDLDYQKQVKLMDDYFAQAQTKGKKVAPGAYAHYALLKSKLGDSAASREYLEKERAAFPDSAQTLDYYETVKTMKTNLGSVRQINDSEQSRDVNAKARGGK